MGELAQGINFEKPGEACNVYGVYAPGQPELTPLLSYFGAVAGQHRGYQSTGIGVAGPEGIVVVKDLGEARSVFNEGVRLKRLPPGEFAVSHDRYTTDEGSDSTYDLKIRASQPIERSVRGVQFALNHNGQLTNVNALQKESGIKRGTGPEDAVSDSDLITLLLAQWLENNEGDLEAAVKATLPRLEGAFSLTILGQEQLIAVRDPHGFRPLALGRIASGGQIVASEFPGIDIAREVVAVEREREITPGEMLVISADGTRAEHPFGFAPQKTCLFEYIYFARPDGSIEGRTIQFAREEMGQALAKRHPVDADFVMGVPESGVPAGQGFANESGLPYLQGLIRNSSLGRTFIGANKELIGDMVGIKLNPIPGRMNGHRVVVVDDSIVRGNTTKKLVSMCFESGAKEVHLRISSPPYKWPCFYGMATRSRDELLAANMSIEEMRAHLGATSLGFLELEDVYDAIGPEAASKSCDSCMTGNYPTQVDESLLQISNKPTHA